MSMILTMRWLATLLLLTSAACGVGSSVEGPEVVAAMYPLAEVAGRVGDGLIAVTELTPPGAEPHDVELGPEELSRIRSAALVLFVGGGFQPAVEDAVAERTGPSVDLLDGLEARRGGTGGHADHAGTIDPHAWLDPVAMIGFVERVTAALVELVPQDALRIERAAKEYAADLRALDGRYRRALSSCARRTLVVSHAAFGHLAARYGLEQHAIAGISPSNEPTAARLAELVDLVREEGVTTIFTETLVDPAVADTLAQEAGVVTDVLDPIEGLTAEQIEAGQEYLAVMDDNLERLRVALGCA